MAGIGFERHFTQPGTHPFDTVAWDRRDAEIKGDDGQVVFVQKGVEAPASWSQLATNIVFSKYAYGDQGSGRRESSVRDIVRRVVETITTAGYAQGVFGSSDAGLAFEDELTYLLIHQMGSFNSPVWFNVGVEAERSSGWVWDEGLDGCRGGVREVHEDEHRPQASACFIQSVGDSMESIMELARSEAMLFKCGSGTGTDLSPLRSSREKLRGGGTASGPVSFLKIYDAIAGQVKSGGRSRRAAKMNTLGVTHPDLLEFIDAKPREDRKARALMAAGYPGGVNGEAYATVAFQNANLSVRATDKFMIQAATGDPAEWTAARVTDGGRVGLGATAAEVLARIAAGTWACGDPGMQFADTINRWHACPSSGPINSSNPCSEYVFLDDSACNLASLNLLKFRQEDGSLDVAGLRAAVRVFITAQEVLVDLASYPTRSIAENSHQFRPLGLGYANLGAHLMASGLPYDSDEGRDLAAAITALTHGEALLQSARLSQALGTFGGFAANRQPMLGVVARHREAASDLLARLWLGGDAMEIAEQARDAIAAAEALGSEHGFRNAQVTLLAPTGTIAFMMDCDTTGIEPDIALVKYKTLSGGGSLKIVNRTVPMALRTLGYANGSVKRIVDHIDRHDTIEDVQAEGVGARVQMSGLNASHLPVFDCAFRPASGSRSLSWRAHLQMMAAVQPFLSGAISKTVNVPEDATVEDIKNVYVEAWRLGVKAVSIYRDGSKGAQPVSVSRDGKASEGFRPAEGVATDLEVLYNTINGISLERNALKDDAIHLQRQLDECREKDRSEPRRQRSSEPTWTDPRRCKVRLGGENRYLHFGRDDQGGLREVFASAGKAGHESWAWFDVACRLVSVGLQHGVPLADLTQHLKGHQFEPLGPTGNPEVPYCQSPADFLGRVLEARGLTAAVPAEEPVQVAIQAIDDEPGDDGATFPAEPRVDASVPVVGPDRRSRAAASAARLVEASRRCQECGTAIPPSGCQPCPNCGTQNGGCN